MNSIIFDCDGVILNSNKIKSKAFYDLVKPFDEEIALKFESYHRLNGGISRYKKFEYLLQSLLTNKNAYSLKQFLEMYSNYTLNALKKCEMFNYLDELKEKFSSQKWYLISGGDQKDLLEIFKYRNIDQYFDGGIFGSPKSKSEIISTLIKEEKLPFPCVFYGDSKYDYDTAIEFKMDFTFVGGWSDMMGWEQFCMDNKVKTITNLNDLL